MAFNFGTYNGTNGSDTGLPFNFSNTNTTPIPQPSGIQVYESFLVNYNNLAVAFQELKDKFDEFIK